MSLHVVIMAGGAGTRFWPLSRSARPKQLLALAGERSLLQATAQRVIPLVGAERVWVVTGAATAAAVRAQLPHLPADNIVAEPCGRDTSACVGLAAHLLLARDSEAVCLVLPADHEIPDETGFRAALAAGAAHVSAAGGLLTYGIRPHRPETGYGYLRLGAAAAEHDGHVVHHLERFVEKPDAATAERYLEEGTYLWNSGMFAWRPGDLLAEIERQLPELAQGLARIARAPELLAEVYPTLPKLSVDYGVMEHARRRWSLPVHFPWSDVGSWSALPEVLAADAAGNITRGRAVLVDTSESVVMGEGVTVAVIGGQRLVVVATPDAVLVAPLDDAQRVKAVVEQLRARGWDDVL